MIETNTQQQRHDRISQQPSYPQTESQIVAGAGPTITCSICDATYAPSPQQAPFLQHEQEVLEATFMGMCHFCFRCRRAACPQCWDEVHSVCGSCVQEAGLPFRSAATPLAGLMFPPASQAPSLPSQPQRSPLFVPLRNGRFYRETQVKPELTPTDITAEHTAVVIPIKISTPEGSQGPRKQEETPRATKKTKKMSRLERILTWIVLVIVLVLVGVIALAEFLPAVNAVVARVTHIDIHGEITYLVHIVQQLFKR